MTDDFTSGPANLVLPEGSAGFDFLERVTRAIEVNLRAAGNEYRKGSTLVQDHLDRCSRLLWILRRDIQKLPTHPGPPQPTRGRGDHTGDAA